MKDKYITNGNVKDCSDNFLQGKIDANLPSKYGKGVFCAQNPSEEDSTCPGDSGMI